MAKEQLTVRTDHDHVVIIFDQHRSIRVPWYSARDIGNAILTKAAEAKKNAVTEVEQVTGPIAVTEILGMPVVTTLPDLERRLNSCPK